MRWPSREPISTCGAALLAAGHHDLAVAPGDRLRRQHHRLQAGAADGVDGQAGHFLRQPRLQQRLARRVLARAGSEHLAHDDFAHLRGIDLGAREHLFDHDRTELRCRNLGERAAELAHGGAGGGNDDDVFHGNSWGGRGLGTRD
jgi:hypothetical protein